MCDIFLSYAREDELRANQLLRVFEGRGWSVFWDRTIPAGQNWRSHIDDALMNARCVVVLWSASSVRSDWVCDEAAEGQRRRILVPALLEDVLPPYGFRSIQAAILVEWDGEATPTVLERMLADISEVLAERGSSPADERSQGHDGALYTASARAQRLDLSLRPKERLAKRHLPPFGSFGESRPVAAEAIRGALGGIVYFYLVLLFTSSNLEYELFHFGSVFFAFFYGAIPGGIFGWLCKGDRRMMLQSIALGFIGALYHRWSFELPNWKMSFVAGLPLTSVIGAGIQSLYRWLTTEPPTLVPARDLAPANGHQLGRDGRPQVDMQDKTFTDSTQQSSGQ